MKAIKCVVLTLDGYIGPGKSDYNGPDDLRFYRGSKFAYRFKSKRSARETMQHWRSIYGNLPYIMELKRV